MFESTARIQAPPTLIPDVDGFASFLDDVQDNFPFHSYEWNFTQPWNADSDLMDVDSPLRLPPYDLLAVGSNGINFYNFEDMGEDDRLELGEEGMFHNHSLAHPVDFIWWEEDNTADCGNPEPSAASSSPSGLRVPSSVPYACGTEPSNVTRRGRTHKAAIHDHTEASGPDVGSAATDNTIVKSFKKGKELPAGTEMICIPEGFQETDTQILRGEYLKEPVVTWAVIPVERWERACKLVVTFTPPPHIFYKMQRLPVMIYNWLLIWDTIIHSFDANPLDLKLAHHLQNSEYWRQTLYGLLPAGSHALVIEALHIIPVPMVLPSEPFPLIWQNWEVPDISSLMSDELLASVVWELNEMLFMFGFILFDDIILSNASMHVSTRRMCREVFLKSYNMRLNLSPTYKYCE
ncbi:hypothetical protein K439DRAFT_1612102 [Ramaria rubella]|nr:hypothetical protein K439DRAFT_1612102 [Ramaria rubella]